MIWAHREQFAVVDGTTAWSNGLVGELHLRQDSPSKGHWHHLHAETPTLVLAPFGVAFGCRALKDPAFLIRLSTHTEGEHSGDREIPWEIEA